MKFALLATLGFLILCVFMVLINHRKVILSRRAQRRRRPKLAVAK